MTTEKTTSNRTCPRLVPLARSGGSVLRIHICSENRQLRKAKILAVIVK